MARVDRKDFEDKLKMYREMGIKYTFRTSGSSLYVESDAGKDYSCSRAISKKEIGFIHTVKQYIKNNDIHKTVKPIIKESRYNRIQYFKYAKGLTDTGKIYEIDITKAYWNMALRLGIINAEIYEKGLTISKVARLATLGSLAKKTYSYRFDGKREVRLPVQKSDDTKHLWFNICHELGKVMDQARHIAGDSFIFYWVDGIYVTDKDVAHEIEEFFKDNDFPATMRIMKRVVVDRKSNRLYIYEKDKPEPRYFPIG